MTHSAFCDFGAVGKEASKLAGTSLLAGALLVASGLIATAQDTAPPAEAAAPVTTPAPAATPAPAPVAAPASASARPETAASPAVAPQSPASPAVPAQAEATPPADAAANPATTTTAAPATAANAEPNPDGCFVPPAKLPLGDVEAFLARPDGIYDLFGRTQFGLTNRIRGLAGSSPRTLDPIIGLARSATAQNKAAIGTGLGRAAFACAKVDPVYAQKIQLQVADLDSPELLAAFVAGSNDVQVAAIAGGASSGGAAAAGLTGGGLAGPGSAGLGQDETVPTTVETYDIGNGSGFNLDFGGDDSSGGGGTVGVPFPAAGTGLPAILMAAAGYWAFRRRRLSPR